MSLSSSIAHLHSRSPCAKCAQNARHSRGEPDLFDLFGGSEKDVYGRGGQPDHLLTLNVDRLYQQLGKVADPECVEWTLETGGAAASSASTSIICPPRCSSVADWPSTSCPLTRLAACLRSAACWSTATTAWLVHGVLDDRSTPTLDAWTAAPACVLEVPV
jgi:hypothetical protein